MSFVPRLILLLVACGALLIGIQVPNFSDQYRKRVDAHLSEVQTNLAPFQEIADRFHNGSLDALIAHHEASSDATFRAEGDAIRFMQQRAQRFQAELTQMLAPLPQQVWHMVRNGDRDLLGETRAQYSFGILLDQTALLAGLALVVPCVLVLELLFAGMRRFVGPDPGVRRHTVR